MKKLGYGVSLGPVVWLYNPEILPEKGISLATLTNWIGVIIIAFLFPVMNRLVGAWPIFMFFGACCLLSLIFILTCVKETKGLTPIQIEEAYVGISANNNNYISL